jgi:hypothetical protein
VNSAQVVASWIHDGGRTSGRARAAGLLSQLAQLRDPRQAAVHSGRMVLAGVAVVSYPHDRAAAQVAQRR